ncbi:MAG: hypothetical protein WD824_25350 [Cyclobacteriaceae bacterium]
MKKVFVLAVVLICLVIVIVAADFRTIPHLQEAEPVKQNCVGYTIIEFDKGIDCHGDTIKLTRKNGFAEKVISSQLLVR